MKYKIILYLLIVSGVAGCGNTPIFTEMKTNRLKVIVKGTLETETISYFDKTDSQSINSTPLQDDSVALVSDSTFGGTVTDTAKMDALPTIFMFDISEVRLNGKKFGRYRTVFESSFSGDSTSEPFFNGTGVELKNDDPGNGHYDTVQVYLRKMIFDKAQVYSSNGSSMTYEAPSEVIFHEVDRSGFDFNQLQVNSYWDSLRTEYKSILRNFPIEIPITGGLDYSRNNDETILEIRFVIKNFVKKYERDYYDEGVFKVCHYYAPSDWLRDVKAGENHIARNLHAVARAYVPGKTAKVTVTAPAGNYVMAIPSTEVISNYILTPKTRGFYCDLPQPPSTPSAYIEEYLDYYLKYEDYKLDWNDAVGNCQYFDSTGGSPNYTDQWDDYENGVKIFKIAPYVAYSSSGSVTFNNMAPGEYTFFYTAKPAYGQLFSSSYTSKGTITVSAGDTVTIP